MTKFTPIKTTFAMTLLVLTLVAVRATAEIVETTLQVPVNIGLAKQAKLKQNITVTIVRESTLTEKHPIALLAHGRPTRADERTRMGQVKYPGNAIWLAQHGFIVVVPTRIGYGATGGPDIDYTGECNNKNYLSGLSGGVQQYQQILKFVRQQSYVDAAHTVIVGESFGGLIALAMAGDRATNGVDGVINFAGGDGGDYNHLEQPCAPEQLEQAFGVFGQQNRVNTLWLYSANDRFWGTVYPQQWFTTFRAAGGRGQFIALPADKNNGHFIFNRNGLAWHDHVENFFTQIGLNKQSATKNTPP